MAIDRKEEGNFTKSKYSGKLFLSISHMKGLAKLVSEKILDITAMHLALTSGVFGSRAFCFKSSITDSSLDIPFSKNRQLVGLSFKNILEKN